MDNNEEFLNLYRRLEMYLNGKYHYADSPIKEHINRLSKSMIKSEVERADVLDFLRNLRNYLVHRNVDEYVEVSFRALEFLKREIEEFESPVKASDVMLNEERVYDVSLNASTLEVLDAIYRNAYDVLPVVDEEKRVIGVFSLEVILKSIYRKKMGKIEKESELSDYREFIGIEDQIKERYEFAAPDEGIESIIRRFSSTEDKKKLKMLFVTESGTKDSPLKGIITPHDVIHYKH